MEDHAVGEGIVAGGHRQGVGHQLGAQMIGHRVADAGLGVAVDHRGQIQPPGPGPEVGDVADQLDPRRVGGEVPADQVGGGRGRGAGDGGGRPPGPQLARLQAQLGHQLADQLRAAGHAGAGQRGMDAPVAVGAIGVVEDRLDQRGKIGAAAGGGRGRSVAPLVEPRRRHSGPRAHVAHGVVVLLRVDELVACAHRYSWAKKAAAFPRNSAFMRSSRFSRSSSRSRARSETVSGGSSSACSVRYLCTQLPRVPSCTWISRATSAIGRDVSITIFTASSLNSGVNFLRRSGTATPPFQTEPYRVRCPESARLPMRSREVGGVPGGRRRRSSYRSSRRTTQPAGREGPLLRSRARGESGLVSAVSARSTLAAVRGDRVRAFQHALYRAAKADPTRRFPALFDKVHRRDVLNRAWEDVRGNRGAAGIDRIILAEVEQYGVDRLLEQLAVDLRQRRYRPLPARRVFIPKPGSSEFRPLSIPTVRDRIVQAACKIVLEPIFEADMLDCSYGFRPRRSAHDALQVLIDESWQGRRWVVETDIANCFEAIPHSGLMQAIEERVCDRPVLGLLRVMLRAGVLTDGSLRRGPTGTPQGGVASPLLANVYLHRLDRAWSTREHGVLVRFADDAVVMCAS